MSERRIIPGGPPDRSPPPHAAPPPPLPAPPEDDRRGFLTRYAGLPEVGWRGTTVGLGALFALLAMFAGTLVVLAFDPELGTGAGRNAAQLVVALTLGGTAVAFAISDARGRIGDGLRRLGLGRFAISALGLALFAWFVYLLVAAGLAPLLQPEQEDVTRQLGTDEGSAVSVIAAGLLIIVAAPLSEELFFRGFMFAGLRRSMSLWPAALVSGLVWGSLHLGSGNLGVVLQLAAFGVILAWLYARSGTLWAPIIAHAINNTIAFTLLMTDVV